MKRKYHYFFPFLIFACAYIFLFATPSIFITAAKNALTLFKGTLFPSIFPFFVLAFLLLNSGCLDLVKKQLEKPMQFIFHLSGKGAFILLLSIISGFPSGSKYIAKLYNEKALTKKESQILLMFTHFANPLFILGTCTLLLQDKKLALLIFISQLLSNLLLGILIRPKEKIIFSDEKKKGKNFLTLFISYLMRLMKRWKFYFSC